MSPADRPARRLLLVTGLSGAGRATALNALEDLGYETVDNLPLALLGDLLEGDQRARKPLALGIDVRTSDFAVPQLVAAIDTLRKRDDIACQLLFLDCDDEMLVRRYTETRRRHPLAAGRPVREGIAEERRHLKNLQAVADHSIDTSALQAADLKRLIGQRFDPGNAAAMALAVVSFSYRAGLPREADLVFDARFLRNPHYQADLRRLTGRDEAVQAFVAADPDFDGFINDIKRLLDRLLPRFRAEGKSYLTIAVGCTGGQHRSVFVAERLAHWLAAQGRQATVTHRYLDGAAGSAGSVEGR